MVVMTDADTAPADEIAPDGTAIRKVATLPGASVVRCTLPAGLVSRAVVHATVAEAWMVVSGRGEMWLGGSELALVPGSGVTIPAGTPFQLRAGGDADLVAVIVTSPPWPGDGEARAAAGPWEATV